MYKIIHSKHIVLNVSILETIIVNVPVMYNIYTILLALNLYPMISTVSFIITRVPSVNAKCIFMLHTDIYKEDVKD